MRYHPHSNTRSNVRCAHTCVSVRTIGEPLRFSAGRIIHIPKFYTFFAVQVKSTVLIDNQRRRYRSFLVHLGGSIAKYSRTQPSPHVVMVHPWSNHHVLATTVDIPSMKNSILVILAFILYRAFGATSQLLEE